MRAETGYALLLTLVLGGLGFALFATYETFDPALRSACAVTQYLSCAKVDSSGDTSILGIPDWSLGVAGFVVLFVVGALAYRTWQRPYLQMFAVVSGLGVLLSLYLLYQEVVVIQGICPVCFTTYVFNVGALATALYLLRQSRATGAADDADVSAAPVASGKASQP